ncbi:MAG: hypothetical protein ACO3RV_00810 [Luteolibacter sp.]
MFQSQILSLALSSFLTIGTVVAGNSALPRDPARAVITSDSSDWQLTLGLYTWAAGLDGTLGAAGFTTDVDISFSDILDSLDMAAMGMVEFNKGPWMLQIEGLYLKNSVKGVIATTPILNRTTSAKLTAETTRLEGIAGYRILDADNTSLELLAGVVYYNIDNTLNFYSPRAVRGVESSDDWFDPMVGLRYRQELSDNWSTQIRGEVGGFGVNADLAWQAVALLGYQLNPSSTTYFGWRHAAVDYQNGGFIYDAAASGPILGLAIRW